MVEVLSAAAAAAAAAGAAERGRGRGRRGSEAGGQRGRLVLRQGVRRAQPVPALGDRGRRRARGGSGGVPRRRCRRTVGLLSL